MPSGLTASASCRAGCLACADAQCLAVPSRREPGETPGENSRPASPLRPPEPSCRAPREQGRGRACPASPPEPLCAGSPRHAQISAWIHQKTPNLSLSPLVFPWLLCEGLKECLLIVTGFVLFTGSSKFYRSVYTSADIPNTSGSKKESMPQPQSNESWRATERTAEGAGRWSRCWGAAETSGTAGRLGQTRRGVARAVTAARPRHAVPVPRRVFEVLAAIIMLVLRAARLPGACSRPASARCAAQGAW